MQINDVVVSIPVGLVVYVTIVAVGLTLLRGVLK